MGTKKDVVKIVFGNEDTQGEIIFKGVNAYGDLYEARIELDKRNIKYKTYARHGLFWTRMYTINDLA